MAAGGAYKASKNAAGRGNLPFQPDGSRTSPPSAVTGLPLPLDRSPPPPSGGKTAPVDPSNSSPSPSMDRFPPGNSGTLHQGNMPPRPPMPPTSTVPSNPSAVATPIKPPGFNPFKPRTPNNVPPLTEHFRNGNIPKASDLIDRAKLQGWTQKPGSGPRTFVDGSGQKRLVIKAPENRPGLDAGSNVPHVEAFDANGQRIDPANGCPTNRKSPGNHREIVFDVSLTDYI